MLSYRISCDVHLGNSEDLAFAKLGKLATARDRGVEISRPATEDWVLRKS